MGEPISLLTYGLVNSAINLIVRPIGEWLGKKIDGDKKHKEALELKDYQHELDLDLLRVTRQYDYQSKQQLQKESFMQRLQEAQDQYRMQMQKWQDQAFDQRVWPLKTPYESFSLKPLVIHGWNSIPIVPCRIFTAKSNKNEDYARYLENTININLSMFLETGYNLGSIHSTISNIGDWRSDEFQEDAFINALWYGLQGQPVLVLNPVISDNGNTLNIRISFWGLGIYEGKLTPDTTTVLKFDLGKERGSLIREESRQLLDLNLPNISQELKFNFDLIQSEANASFEKRDILIEKNVERYRLAAEVVNTVNKRLSKQISDSICCFSGLYCDIYHLIEYGTAPIMPEKMLSHSPQYCLTANLGKFYQGVLTRLTMSNYHGSNMKYIYLKTAQSLLASPYLSQQAINLIKEGMCLWAAEKNITNPINHHDDWNQFIRLINASSGLGSDDACFLQQAATVLRESGNQAAAAEIERFPKLVTLNTNENPATVAGINSPKPVTLQPNKKKEKNSYRI